MAYIRQAALGEALVPFDQRVQAAMQTIRQSRAWTPVQLRWLTAWANNCATNWCWTTPSSTTPSPPTAAPNNSTNCWAASSMA